MLLTRVPFNKNETVKILPLPVQYSGDGNYHQKTIFLTARAHAHINETTLNSLYIPNNNNNHINFFPIKLKRFHQTTSQNFLRTFL